MIRSAVFLAAAVSLAASATVRAQDFHHWMYESQPGGLPPMSYAPPYAQPWNQPSWQYQAPTYRPPPPSFYDLPTAQDDRLPPRGGNAYDEQAMPCEHCGPPDPPPAYRNDDD